MPTVTPIYISLNRTLSHDWSYHKGGWDSLVRHVAILNRDLLSIRMKERCVR